MSQEAGGSLVQYDLTLPMSPEAELVAARATEEIARLIGFPSRAIEQVRLAVIEACLNAFEHSESPDRRVYLNFISDEDKLLIVVRDFGKGFDPLEVRQPDIHEKIGAMNKGGWGLYLIRKLMDEVFFERVSAGTCLRMTKHRTPAAPCAPACPSSSSS
jgi:serine/threonine-protein kinase RsbW